MSLRLARFASLGLSFAFGIIGMAVGINALVKYKEQKRQLLGAIPQGATVNIDTSDVLNTGYVVTVVSGLIALVSSFPLLATLVPFARRLFSFRLLSILLGFLSIWLFATLVAFDVFFANRSAKVSAFLGTFPIPEQTIQQVVRGLGASTKYSEIDYLRLPAVLPWFAMLFGFTSSAILFAESRKASRATAYPVSSAGYDRKDGESVEQQEVTEKQKPIVEKQDV